MKNCLLFLVALLVTSCTALRPPEKQSTKPSPAPTAGTSAAVQITDATYEEVIRSQKIVLLLFWAPWSAPDRELMPIVDALANEYSDRVKVGKVDVDENPKLAQKFLIKGIPTLVILKDGIEQERTVGLVRKRTITDLLDKQLSN